MKHIFLAAAMAAAIAPAARASEFEPAMQAFLESSIATWAADSVLIEAIRAQNGATAGYDAATIDAMDQTWRAEVGTTDGGLIGPVLSNAAAEFLRGQVAASGGVITEVFIMDAVGLNVAASAVTSDYWQGDEDKFLKTYPMGPGAVHFSDVEFDESTQTYQAQISIALTDPATGSVVGAMTVGVVADALM